MRASYVPTSLKTIQKSGESVTRIEERIVVYIANSIAFYTASMTCYVGPQNGLQLCSSNGAKSTHY